MQIRGAGGSVDADDAATWQGLASELRGAHAPDRLPAYWRLYALARALALRTVRSGFRGLEADDALDVVEQLFARRLDAVVAAENPRAFVRTCVHRGLCSATRSPRRRMSELDEQVLGGLHVGHEDDVIGALHGRLAYSRLGAREREVLSLVAAGYDRGEIGACLGVSRGAVDQIVSRARRKGAIVAERGRAAGHDFFDPRGG